MTDWREILRKKDQEKAERQMDWQSRVRLIKVRMPEYALIPALDAELNAKFALLDVKYSDVWNGLGSVETINEINTHTSTHVDYGNRVSTETTRTTSQYEVYRYGYRLVYSSGGVKDWIEISAGLPILGSDIHPKAVHAVGVKSYHQEPEARYPEIVTQGTVERKSSGELKMYNGWDNLGNEISGSVVKFNPDDLKHLLAVDCRTRTQRRLLPKPR